MTRTLGTALSVGVEHAVVRHGGRELASVHDLRLEPGHAVTIVGESGSGKSVLAHALMGTLAPDLEAEGSMTVAGRSYDLADRRSRRALWGSQFALLPQEPSLALDPTMRVRAQVAEGARGWRPRDRSFSRQADERLTALGLAQAAHAYPHTLSGGMAQRVAYCAATIGGAPLLVVDEPSKGLDAHALDRLATLLAAHLAGGGLLLMITHDLRLARRLGGTVMVMREASVIESGPAEEVLVTPSHTYTQRLVAADPQSWDRPWMSSPPAPGPDLVTARGIAKSYGATPLFRDLDLTIRAGERWALTGASGTGKTTLGDVLLRLEPVDTGTVTHTPHASDARLQKLYQDPGLSFPRRVPLIAAMDDVRRRHGVARERMDSLVERVGLSPDLLRRRPDQVSGGELQRMAIVRAMLPRPALVFADEATSRLDLINQQATMDILMTEVAEDGCALLLVTHDEGLAAAVADQHLDLGGVTNGATSRSVSERSRW